MKTNTKLENLSSGKKSNWRQQAEHRIKNKKWLRYSSNIAMRVLAAIEGKVGYNQVDLAKELDVSPQQVSKIVKGHENLTLETIAKLSDALGIEVISFPEYKYSQPVSENKDYVKIPYVAAISTSSFRGFDYHDQTVLQNKCLIISMSELSGYTTAANE